ncbi:MAG: HEAT repeat domain-containing protein [Nitrospirota bacterium]
MNKYKKFFKITIFILFFPSIMEESIAENIDELISNLESRDWRIRLSAVEELGRIKDEKSINLLMNVAGAKSEVWQVKIKAIRLLGEIGDPKAIDLLAKIFNDPFLNFECPAIKWNTATALGSFKKSSRVVDMLINALDDDNLIIKEAVIQSLGKIGDTRAVPFLIPALHDKSFAIKLSAIKALGEIGDPQAIPSLKEIADKDNDLYIKNEALSVLKTFANE